MIRLKRAYEPAAPEDGFRILVERLWPRGLSKQSAKVDLWLKEISPSPELRTWYGHDLDKWNDFVQRYRLELHNNPAILVMRELIQENRMITFVYAARDEEHNSAQVLKDFLEES